jgi:hypothetical protein
MPPSPNFKHGSEFRVQGSGFRVQGAGFPRNPESSSPICQTPPPQVPPDDAPWGSSALGGLTEANVTLIFDDLRLCAKVQISRGKIFNIKHLFAARGVDLCYITTF